MLVCLSLSILRKKEPHPYVLVVSTYLDYIIKRIDNKVNTFLQKYISLICKVTKKELNTQLKESILYKNSFKNKVLIQMSRN